MPLSEHEQRQLEQIEQALYTDYPRFANAVRSSDPRVRTTSAGSSKPRWGSCWVSGCWWPGW